MQRPVSGFPARHFRIHSEFVSRTSMIGKSQGKLRSRATSLPMVFRQTLQLAFPGPPDQKRRNKPNFAELPCKQQLPAEETLTRQPERGAAPVSPVQGTCLKQASRFTAGIAPRRPVVLSSARPPAAAERAPGPFVRSVTGETIVGKNGTDVAAKVHSIRYGIL